MARLLTAVQLPLLEAPSEALGRLRGANTPQERETLLAELAAQKSGAG